MHTSAITPDIRTKSKLGSAMKTGRSIHHNGTRIDFSNKAHGQLIIPSYDSIGMPWSIGPNMIDSFLAIFHHFNIQS